MEGDVILSESAKYKYSQDVKAKKEYPQWKVSFEHVIVLFDSLHSGSKQFLLTTVLLLD